MCAIKCAADCGPAAFDWNKSVLVLHAVMLLGHIVPVEGDVRSADESDVKARA